VTISSASSASSASPAAKTGVRHTTAILAIILAGGTARRHEKGTVMTDQTPAQRMIGDFAPKLVELTRH